MILFGRRMQIKNVLISSKFKSDLTGIVYKVFYYCYLMLELIAKWDENIFIWL